MAGKVLAIHLTTGRGTPMADASEAKLIPDLGIEGDRHFKRASAGKQRPEAALTLFETETLEAVRRDCDLELAASETRRSILTQGVALNHLIGRKFRVGEVRCEGTELCEPCGHLEKLTRPGVRNALVHRGGIRARILSEGVIRPGDAITLD